MKNKKGLIIVIFLLVCIVCAWYMTNFGFSEDLPQNQPGNEIQQENQEAQSDNSENQDADGSAQGPGQKDSTGPGSEENVDYYFRSEKLLSQHYDKHGRDMGFASAAEYEKAASAVINNPEALYKTEAEDGDGVYYIEETNEFVVLSTDGYIRTYFLPDSGKKYFDKQ